MSNSLVGDVYDKIIVAVINSSRQDFEENGVNPSTLVDFEKEWKKKLSARDVAHMPWDPKPEPAQSQQVANSATSHPSAANGVPSYGGYGQQPSMPNGGPRIKSEPGSEAQHYGMPTGYPPQPLVAEGGQARAQQLTAQYAQARGLALPGQRPQGMPNQNVSSQQAHAQQMYMQQQRQQQAALQQQQSQPRIKVENPAYAQTDGADDALEDWHAYMAERRAARPETSQHADHMMRNQVLQMSSDLQSGLMMTLDELPSNRKGKSRVAGQSQTASAAASSIPQLDGELDLEDEKPIKDEDDADAINSDLDSDNDPTGELDDEDDDFGDSILCTYDKVQRVKNKWKCILKDGVMSINNKEWVFHKGTGEFEW